jgi:GTP-binding protein
MCCKNFIPSPAPSDAPSISPGMSAITTLRPHLGTIEGSDSSFVIADIPGLIEGASEGAGLGIKFLQHISRTGLLLIFVDLYSTDNLDPIEQIKLLKNELSAYKDDLTQKVSWIVCNKIDLINKDDLEIHSSQIQEELGISNKDIFFIPAATGEGTQKLLQSLEEVISQSKLDLT